MEATEPHTHQDEESVNLARARLTLSSVLALYSLDHIGDLPGEGSQTLLRIVLVDLTKSCEESLGSLIIRDNHHSAIGRRPGVATKMRIARCGATSVDFAPLGIALGIVLLEGAYYESMQGAVVDDEDCLLSIHSLVVVFETFLALTPYLTARGQRIDTRDQEERNQR